MILRKEEKSKSVTETSFGSNLIETKFFECLLLD